ncbi:Tat pathway signal protein [Salinadaptatus halalkaliphilus]|uniref:Tat pathway signal protein n=1 Tax=Salinadaptatus halalkaliphilus TaxID=2419781 RepID=A0A4S3TPE3_9EURY|nr:Tat pathway signal protein [Salinadaptatus halalkaliphilus]THE65035.1 Tat pathway signal protein [Salinadaptatus halalkaliphilus]
MTLPDRSSLSRRDYVRGLVAAGGATALGACLDVTSDGPEPDVPSGTDDPASLPDRQHAWNDSLSTDADGTIQLPEHHVLCPLALSDAIADGTDIDDERRETVEAGLQTLERAYEWSNEGLVFTIGYTPAYFARFDDSLPDSVDLPDPEALTAQETPEFDEFDALLHLASDHPSVVLEAEEGLFGDREQLNGLEVETDLSDVFDRVVQHRRTGFIGEGLPAEHADVDGVPDSIHENAPFFMGFRSGFADSQATEDRVTIEDGPFAGGATMHVSSMAINLTQWFQQENHYQRVSKLFSPDHADEELAGEYGEALGGSSAMTPDRIDATEADARERGVVGHAQKAARAREDGEPLLLRRDFNTVDGDQPGLHFVSLQDEIDAFVRVREAMTGTDLEVARANSGILHYLFVNRRGNYLLPARDARAVPTPTSDSTDV